MSTGSIRINESPKNEMVSDINENVVECLLVHGMEDDSTDASGAFRLRRGEIAVIGFASSKSLPLFNLNERTDDIRLTSGEFATINSRNTLGEMTDSIDVVVIYPYKGLQPGTYESTNLLSSHVTVRSWTCLKGILLLKFGSMKFISGYSKLLQKRL